MAQVDKEKIQEVLQEFILRVASDTNNKRPEEIAILPAVAQLVLTSDYLLNITQ